MKKKRAKSIRAFQWQLQSEMIILNATATVAGPCYPDLFPGARSKQTAHSLLSVLALRRSVTCRAIYRLTSAKPLTARNNAHIFILVSEQRAKLTCEIPGCKTVLEGRPISVLKTEQHLRGYGKQVGCVTQAKISLPSGAKTPLLWSRGQRAGQPPSSTPSYPEPPCPEFLNGAFEAKRVPSQPLWQFVCLSDFSRIEKCCKLVLTTDKCLRAAGLHVHFAAHQREAYSPHFQPCMAGGLRGRVLCAPAWRMLRSAPNCAQCCAHGVQSERETQKGTNGSMGPWQQKAHYLQSHKWASFLKTAADVHSCWQSAVQALSNPKSAWKRQHNRVRMQPHNKASSVQEKECYGELAASGGGRETPALELWVIF